MSIGLGKESVAHQPQAMSPEQLKRFLSSEIQNAMFYIDTSENISASRFRNWEYYRGVMSDLPSYKGQTSVVSSEMSDYIQMLLPSLLRPFTSGDKIWDYTPSNEADQEKAKLLSRYINEVVFKKDNRGEIILNNWAFDACVQKNGVVKVWWEDKTEFKDSSHEGLTDPEYALASFGLQSNQEIIAYDKRDNPDIPGGFLHDLQIRTSIKASRCRVAAIPIEEFIISRDARDYDDAVLKCHRTWEVAGKLIEDGYDPAVINRLPTYNETRSQLTRPGTAGREQNRQNIGDPAMRKVMVYEGIVRCNYDGAGVRDWYFKAGGQDGGVELLEIEPHECQIFFCDFCPEPIPHQFVGTCPGDRLSQIQQVNTVVTRQMLQAMYLQNAPQREVVADNILSPEQLNNYAPGANIMVKAIGTVNPITLNFNPAYCLELLQHFDGKASDRVGVSRATAGLDPDALNNQSATGANLQFSKSQERVEMMAKIWAHTGLRRLGEAILKIVLMYQDFTRAVLLDGKPVSIDPREFGNLSDMEVTVSTGLGTGHRDRDRAFLMTILAMQQQVLKEIGPNPSVDFTKVVRTAQKIVECGGISNPEAYFGNIPDGWAPEPVPPQPSPDAIVKAKTDLQKTAAQEQTKQTDIATKSQLKLREQDMQALISLIETIITAQAKDTRLPTAYKGTGN